MRRCARPKRCAGVVAGGGICGAWDGARCNVRFNRGVVAQDRCKNHAVAAAAFMFATYWRRVAQRHSDRFDSDLLVGARPTNRHGDLPRHRHAQMGLRAIGNHSHKACYQQRNVGSFEHPHAIATPLVAGQMLLLAFARVANCSFQGLPLHWPLWATQQIA